MYFSHLCSTVDQPTPTTLRLSCTDKTAGETTLTHRPVALTPPRWFPLPVVGCPHTAWWELPWTWAPATSSPVEVLTWSTEETWREVATTSHTRRAPHQLWWASFHMFFSSAPSCAHLCYVETLRSLQMFCKLEVDPLKLNYIMIITAFSAVQSC